MCADEKGGLTREEEQAVVSVMVIICERVKAVSAWALKTLGRTPINDWSLFGAEPRAPANLSSRAVNSPKVATARLSITDHNCLSATP